MIGNRVCFFQSLESTNSYMKDHIKDYEHGNMIVSRIQTAGRGRRDRKWVSTDGNLHVSLLLDTEVAPLDDFEVVMRTSVAVVRALASFGVNAQIKYPNDIVVSNHKIAGMLIEKVGAVYIIGIGVNVTFNNVTGYDFHPSSILLETSRFVDYRDVLSAVIDAYNELLKQPKVAVYEEYKILSIVYNNRISIDGSEHLVVDITQNGDLVLDQATGPRVTPNEVSLTSWYDE